MSKLFARVSYWLALPAWVLGFASKSLNQVVLNIDVQGHCDLQMCLGWKLAFLLRFLLYLHFQFLMVFLLFLLSCQQKHANKNNLSKAFIQHFQLFLPKELSVLSSLLYCPKRMSRCGLYRKSSIQNAIANSYGMFTINLHKATCGKYSVIKCRSLDLEHTIYLAKITELQIDGDGIKVHLCQLVLLNTTTQFSP